MSSKVNLKDVLKCGEIDLKVDPKEVFESGPKESPHKWIQIESSKVDLDEFWKVGPKEDRESGLERTLWKCEPLKKFSIVDTKVDSEETFDVKFKSVLEGSLLKWTQIKTRKWTQNMSSTVDSESDV